MYRPPAFDVDDNAALFRVIRDNSFALLVSFGPDGLIASHIPIFLKTDGDGLGRLYGHLARQNEQWRGFDGKAEAMTVFQGPHAYVSPSWYASELMVPTWNYVAVHAYGRPRALADPAHSRAHLANLVATYESPATGPWSMARLPDGYVERMIKGIVAFEMPIERLEGKFKLSQNRAAADRNGAIKGLEASGDAVAKEVARLMREFAPAD